MIELPDGKICRSLPEQVAENAKNIKIISEILDGLNIQDNLVVIADISQILTRSELDVVEKPIAFLYYGDQLYIKKNEVGGSAFFDVIFSISGSTVISFASKEIEVNLSTGALSLTTSTVSTYSKSEIDTLLSSKADTTYVDTQLAGKADLSGANFTGAITAPSIIENMSGYTASKYNVSSYAIHTLKYAGIVKNGNKITFVGVGEITRTATAGNIPLVAFGIPASIGTKLYPINSSWLALYKLYLGVDLTNGIQIPAIMIKNSDDSLRFDLYDTNTLTANQKYYYRFECTFLLSENLAA